MVAAAGVVDFSQSAQLEDGVVAGVVVCAAGVVVCVQSFHFEVTACGVVCAAGVVAAGVVAAGVVTAAAAVVQSPQV